MIKGSEISKGQVDGKHYSQMPIQPVHFGMVNRLDACAYSILKYVSRHRQKNGRVDVQKALHFIELRSMLGGVGHQVTDWPITPEEYCRENRMSVMETAVIIGLGLWLQTGQQHYAAEMKSVLAEILTTYDSTGA
ncbi:DUF3310 domain-containing protein [Pseudomonas stutzeri]|uniref:DUF3310 domain-containing protein n=1 Tax=Stutzerimonas stutzeri TaxID=316 RepID=UPI00210CCE3B|nr:DUF3310 domain-containing protein [Stutzerimonas stutzeri]